MLPSPQAGDGPVETVTILARLWCRAEGNDPDDTISDAGHTVLDHLLSGQDRKSLAAVKKAAREIAALAAPAAVAVPEEVRRALSSCSKEEIAAWEAYGEKAGLDMHEHPLHYLFLDDKTYAARHGWKAGIDWALSLLATPPSGRAAEGEETWREAPGSSTPNSEQRPGQACIRPQTLRNQGGTPQGDSRKDGPTPPTSAGAAPAGWVADEPTPEMYAAARDWSRGKYGMPIGDEASRGCWQVMLWRAPVDLCALAAAPATPEPAAGGERDNWRDDPSADDRWNAGLDYGQTQLCAVLGVDPQSVSWDAATETLDGDVQSVICNILTVWGGDDWRDLSPPIPTPADAEAREGR